jgi:hypothetical protein
MKSAPQTINARLGHLAEPLHAKLAASGEDRSDYARRLIAADLGIEPPAMDGNVANLKQFSASKPKRSQRGNPS